MSYQNSSLSSFYNIMDRFAQKHLGQNLKCFSHTQIQQEAERSPQN